MHNLYVDPVGVIHCMEGKDIATMQILGEKERDLNMEESMYLSNIMHRKEQ